MLRAQERALKIEQALRADLQAIKAADPPGFRLDPAVAKFAHRTLLDERARVWAARVERQPSTGMFANIIDRVGFRRLVAGAILVFGGAATAGAVKVLQEHPLTPSRTVEEARLDDASAARPKVNVTPLPVSSPNVSPPPGAVHRRHTPPAGAGNGVEQEIAHMVVLRQLVEGHPRRAMAWAEKGHRQFVKGALFEEREALYVLALIKAEGVNAATLRARAFLRRFPRGSFAARIQHAVKR